MVIVGIIGIIIGIAWGLYYRRRARRWLNENIIIFWPLALVIHFAVWIMDLMWVAAIGVFFYFWVLPWIGRIWGINFS